MNYYKIEPTNRYFEVLQLLRRNISANRYFSNEYNEDKERYYFDYRKPNLKINDNVIESKKIIASIDKYFSENLFTPQEKSLLLYNLIPFANDFGKDVLRHLLARTDVLTYCNERNITSRADFTEKMMFDVFSEKDRVLANQILNFRKSLSYELNQYDKTIQTFPQQSDTPTETAPTEVAKEKAPTKLVLGAFCRILEKAEIIARQTDETNANYCERICTAYQ